MRLPDRLRRRIDHMRRRGAFLAAGIPLQLLALPGALLVLPVRRLTTLQYGGFQALLGVELPPPQRGPGRPGPFMRWRQPVHHRLVGLLVALAALRPAHRRLRQRPVLLIGRSPHRR